MFWLGLGGQLIHVNCKLCTAPCPYKPEQMNPRTTNCCLTIAEASKEFIAHGHTPAKKTIDQILLELFDHYKLAHKITVDQTLLLPHVR